MSKMIECPRCGTQNPDQGDSVPAACRTCNFDLKAVPAASQLELDVSYQIAAPPLDSKAEILEATNERLMLSIPSGGKRAHSLGCFALLWMLITGAVSGVFLAVGLDNIEGDAPPAVLYGLFGLFWLIGLGMLYFAIKMKYTRGYLFLSRERAVHQSIFLGRKKNTEVFIDANTQARLVEAYQENNTPVYRVEMKSDDNKIAFGTALSEDLKDWYIQTINGFLSSLYESSVTSKQTGGERGFDGQIGSSSDCPMCGTHVSNHAADRCDSCGAALERVDQKIVAAIPRDVISPEEMSADSFLKVARTSTGEWEIRYPMAKLADNWSGGGCLLGFGLLWESFVVAFSAGAWQTPGFMKYFMLIFMIPFHLIGIGLLLVSLFSMLGAFRLRLGAMQSSARWYLGPLGYSMKFATSSITEVKLIHGGAFPNLKKNRNSRSQSSNFKGISCILIAAGKRIPVTSSSSAKETREAVGLIRYCLRDLGHRLQDE